MKLFLKLSKKSGHSEIIFHTFCKNVHVKRECNMIYEREKHNVIGNKGGAGYRKVKRKNVKNGVGWGTRIGFIKLHCLCYTSCVRICKTTQI